MRKGLSLVIVLMLVFSVSAVVFARPGQGGGQIVTGQPDFDATIEIAGVFEVQVGDSTTLTATWSTNGQDVTNESWSIDGYVEQADEIPKGQRTSGESTVVFNATELEPGDYQVCFRIWHHNPNQSDRNATECVIITVIAADDEEECPAAPAIAGRLLRENGIIGKAYSDYITLVTNEMHSIPGSCFQGVEKCDGNGEPNPDYEAAVDEFLQDNGAY